MAGERILVVEDDRAVARGLEYALQADGYAVLTAPTAARALELARTADPHLALLDVRLPDGSGLDICRTLRGEGRRLDVDVVPSTGPPPRRTRRRVRSTSTSPNATSASAAPPAPDAANSPYARRSWARIRLSSSRSAYGLTM